MKSKKPLKSLAPDKLRRKFDPDTLGFEVTDEIQPIQEIIGQKRALKALEMGLEIRHRGYNIFIAGMIGTGRRSTIKNLLEKLDLGEETPDDICYVNNFQNPESPKAMLLPAGRGGSFRNHMKKLIEMIRRDFPKLFESDAFLNNRKKLLEGFTKRGQTILKALEAEASQEGFAVLQMQLGQMVRPEIVPIVDGKPVPIEQLKVMTAGGEFPEDKLRKMMQTYEVLREKMLKALKESQNIFREMEEAISKMEADFITPVLTALLKTIKERFDYEAVKDYLEDVNEFVLENLDFFKGAQKSEEGGEILSQDPLDNLMVNLIVDNSRTKGRPIIVETNPSYKNLFGSIDKTIEARGMLSTDFTKIRAGSILKARGGFLILNLLDIFSEKGIWEQLKRVLRHGELEIQNIEPFPFAAVTALKPEPIETDVKVIVIGDHQSYYYLYQRDPDFSKIFKVKADFDTVMEVNDKNIADYASFARMACDVFGLKSFDKTAVAALLEYSLRLSGRQDKLSTRFTAVSDILKEADYWAGKDDANTVQAEHIEKAVEEWIERHAMIEDKIQEMIDEGTLFIDIKGTAVGQINGLSVYDTGEYSFGKPARITVRTAVGKEGVINIEREAQLSGSTYNKGILIISGYLQGLFAQKHPLAVNASICFEQSYSGVDGDSASSTEIYAILSALAEVPLRQDIAVTGSVNQKGEIQPVGGVNQKIEGFFKVCKAKGLTGEQGVMIPHTNEKDLMLMQEVVKAVKEGKFHIYSVKRIEEGLEILTGFPAGGMDDKGNYPSDSVFGRAQKKLAEYAEIYRRFSVMGE
ncbi:AAA family ATPase [bacterium]|nr:AAA family ATPase [bacterium]